MTEKTRSQNAKRNIVYGYIAQICTFLLSFVGRKIFLYYLSADYLGINGLYTNILTVLSMAELGIDSAFVYSLFKPVAERNYDLINSLLHFFRKFYLIFAIAVLAAGMAVVPFLKYIVKTDISQTDLVFFYVVNLFNMIITYFVAHKTALLTAFQEQRIQRFILLISNFLLQIIQIIVLITFKDYHIYVLSSAITLIIYNVVLSIATERLHPEVFKAKTNVVFDKSGLYKRIRATLMYRLGVVLITSTDNILISVLVSISVVGLYSNYYSVVNAFTTMIAVINASLIPGLGNMAVKEGRRQQKEFFDMMLLIYHLLAALGLIGFSLLFNDLITIWLGAEYLLDNATVFIISLNFYFTYAVAPVWILREANGLFDDVKYILLIRAAINIVLSIVLGMYLGTFGIFLATTISHLITNFWYEPGILSRKLFENMQKRYWLKQLKYMLITVVCYAACYFSIHNISCDVIALILKTVIVCAITILVFCLTNFRTAEFAKFKTYLINKKI